MPQGKIGKELILFTVPLILSGLLQQIFNWVDAFIVGFTTGISVLTAQIFGKGEKEKITDILFTFVIILGMGFFVIALFGFFSADEILTLLNTPGDIFGISKEYLKFLVMGIPCLAVYNAYSAALQAGISSVGNIVLQRFMNGFGQQTVAAITTAYRVDSDIILPIVNFGSGIATIVAQNTGAGNKEQAKRY